MKQSIEYYKDSINLTKCNYYIKLSVSEEEENVSLKYQIIYIIDELVF